MPNDTESTTNNRVVPMAMPGVDGQDYQRGTCRFEPAVNFMIFIRRMLVLGWRPGRLVLYWLSGKMLMKDSAKQQVGAPSGHKAPADEGTAL